MLRITYRTIILSILALPALGAGAASAACAPGPFRMSLPDQPLAERLPALNRATGCAVDADPALVSGIGAPALEGNLTTDQAFFASVAGTGLEAGPTQGRWRISTDAQDSFSQRVSDLEAELRARPTLADAEAERLNDELSTIRQGVQALVRQQGFLSAAESASFNRSLDEIAASLRT